MNSLANKSITSQVNIKRREIMAKKNKYPVEETSNADVIECVYCGHAFNGNKACNGDMDCSSVKCPECKKEMEVTMSIVYTCYPQKE